MDPMILLRRLSGPLFTLNPDLIERAEATPDTVVTLIGGNKYVISESLEELVELIKDYRARIIAAAKTVKPDAAVETLVRLAGKARREGLLALEAEAAEVEDDFLRRGLQLAIDGTDSEEVAIILGSEVDTKRAADRASAKLFENMGGYAPT